MRQSRGVEPVRMGDRRYATWNVWGKVKHLVRWHTYVPLEEWDPATGSMQYIGMICWHCPKRI
jgi:hypothetical protein